MLKSQSLGFKPLWAAAERYLQLCDVRFPGTEVISGLHASGCLVELKQEEETGEAAGK